MRQAFAAKFGDLEDRHIPSKEYIEKKLAELESGEFRAEPLSEVISRDEVDPDTLQTHWDAKGTISIRRGGRDEVDPDTLQTHWDAKGTISIRRGGSKTAMPSGPEQLRLRLTVLQNALIMIQLRHPGREELKDVRDSYLDRIRAKEFDAILLSPPCASFSRGSWANFRGPRPVRSYELPRGLEKLTPVERDRAILRNIFADFSFEIATLVAEGAATFHSPRTLERYPLAHTRGSVPPRCGSGRS
eukprot:s15183_g1.t1